MFSHSFLRLHILIFLLGNIYLAEGQPSGNQAVSSPTPARSSGISNVEIETATVNANGSALISISFTPAGQSVTAVQFDIGYEDQHLALWVIPGDAVNNAGKSIWKSNPQQTVERIVIAGLNQTPITDGILATLSVQVKSDAPPGRYPLMISEMVAVDNNGYPAPVLGDDGGVVVPGEGIVAPIVLSVANAASYISGSVAPGEIVVVGGNWLGASPINAMQVTSTGLLSTFLAGTRVLFDGIPAPLIYTTQEQVAAIVPYAVDERSQTSVQVEYQGIRSAPIILPVAGASPAIFTLDQSGTGQGAIINEDGTVNGPDNPAARGSVVSVYGTGEGQTEPPGRDGLIVEPSNLCRPLRAVTVSIGGQSADVLYAGSAGNQVSGLFQVNVRIPLSLTPDSSAPVTITIDRISQTGVTMAVQ